MDALELWGGPECTVIRIEDRYGDQLRLTGHHDREDDLDRLAELGISAVRYPVLWERVSPDHPEAQEWAWRDRRIAGLRTRGIRPIVGLVHHGSGPRYTDLLADDFASGVARHARSVAERYAWVRDWTPINEPCTTARFSCLYGHWYPHHRTEQSFWLALLNQIDATRLAMREIRAVNPAARLVQTDDLGRTYATVAVREQAAFDNVRRWMGWDLLFGRVVPGHPFWNRLCGYGLEQRLRRIADVPCPPDIIGINHYLTSDRFLDHRIQRYPRGLRGGNARCAFVDTEAVRVLQPPPPGIAGVLREAWDRYRAPIAITEVHNGSTREEQMRWTYDAWQAAQQLRADGVDVRGVTNWALFGSSGWNTLLTAPGLYEPGVFDVRGGRPRATAMVPLLQSLANGADPTHPVLRGDGWWRRDIRLHHPGVARPAPMREQCISRAEGDAGLPPHILITGATGRLGQALSAACTHRHLRFHGADRATLDLTDPGRIDALLDQQRPWVVINAAGRTRIDHAEPDARRAPAIDSAAALALAQACAARGIATITMSSDQVFDGALDRAYLEDDAPGPLNADGRSQALAEDGIRALAGTHLIVRSAGFFSPFDADNFATRAIASIARGAPFTAAEDQVVSPTYLPDLCNALLDLAIDGESGIWHLTNGEGVTWADFARRLAEASGLDARLVVGRPGAELGQMARRPAHAALATRRGQLLPPLQRAIERFGHEIAAGGQLRGRAAA